MYEFGETQALGLDPLYLGGLEQLHYWHAGIKEDVDFMQDWNFTEGKRKRQVWDMNKSVILI